MAILSDYTAGTVTVAANGTAVTGVGTGWLTAEFREGDLFIANGWFSVIQSVNSNTSLTLYPTGQRGGALSAAPYRLRYMSDGSRASAQARQLINIIGGSGNLEAIGGLTSAPNTMPYFTGAGTAAVTPLTAFARSLLDDTNATDFWATIGTTSPPQSAFRRGNVLGTVGQSGGVPNNALIERGSNANGSYVKFADGTQICTGEIVVPSATSVVGSGFITAGPDRQLWTYPVSFATTVGLSVFGNLANVDAVFANVSSINTGAAQVLLGALISRPSITAQTKLLAIGRWF